MDVLKSNRFQALVVLSIFVILGQYDILSEPIVTAAITILGGHIGIRTIDRFSENIGKK